LKVPTPEGDSISAPFRSEELAATRRYLKTGKLSNPSFAISSQEDLAGRFLEKPITIEN